MIGLDYLMAGYLHLASADVSCRLKETPQINVSALDTVVKYDHSKSQKQLDRFDVDTVSPYSGKIQTHVGGLMSGEISVIQNTRIVRETFTGLNTGCLYIHSVNVKIRINPTIYIASNYKKGGCMYNAILEHEKKHLVVDREIVNKYSQMIASGLKDLFHKTGYAHGPYRMAEIPHSQKSIEDRIEKSLRRYADEMSAERQNRQQAIDNLAEYERVNKKCPGET